MKTVLYVGFSNSDWSGIGLNKFVDAAHILGYELVEFSGYTRFGHDDKQRAENLAAINEITTVTRQRTGNKMVRMWDVADEDTIRRDDAEWCARFDK